MADHHERTCLSVGVSKDGTSSVLIVSTDEERLEYLSSIFEYKDFLANSTGVVFQEPRQISAMWVSESGKYYLSEVFGSCFTNISGSFVCTQLTDLSLYVMWGLNENAVYTAGQKGTFFKFNGNVWSPLSVPTTANIYAVHGLHENFVVCAGDQGYAALWDGVEWKKLNIPDAISLRSVFVENEKLIYFGGVDGACIRLRDGRVEVISGGSDSIGGIASWRDELYFGTHHAGVFKLNGNSLELVRSERPAAAMRSSKDFLFTCGLNKFSRFDGVDWKSRPFT